MIQINYLTIIFCLSVTALGVINCNTSSPLYSNADLVNVQKISPNIIVDLEFARENNPLKQVVYPQNVALVRGELADKLRDAALYLEKYDLRLKIWAAYRPLSVQKMMYEKYSNPNWISHPDSGRRTHTRGVAIDCTLVDSAGNELKMPTGYLDFENHEKMASDYQDLPEEVITNREFLIRTMETFGLQNYSGEWWHFELPNWSAYWLITRDLEIYGLQKDIIPREELYK